MAEFFLLLRQIVSELGFTFDDKFEYLFGKRQTSKIKSPPILDMKCP